MVVNGQRHSPADLPPGKTWYPLYRRLGRPQGRSGRVRKISSPPGFDPRTVQPVASRCTDWAIPAHFIYEVRSVYLYVMHLRVLWTSRLMDCSTGYSASSYRGGAGSNFVQSMWDLWWTKWQWDRFYPNTSTLPCPVHYTSAPRST